MRQLSKTKRIFLNIFATYGQSVVSLVVGLFCSRWVYIALGTVDFGLFSLVGSIIIFITFINTTFSYSASRHFAYVMGQETLQSSNASDGLLCQWFNSSLFVHIVLPLLLVAIGYPVGMYLIYNVLTIPPNSIFACAWVFRISLMTAFASMCFVPFLALYTAKQLIFVKNLTGILQTFLHAVAAWWLLHFNGNRLLGYAIAILAITCIVNLMLAAIAFLSFPECKLRFQYWAEKKRARALISFAGYNLLENIGHLLRTHGVAMVLNIKFGPTINAANGIGNQIASKITILPTAITSAVSPEITSLIGAKKHEQAIKLGTRISFYSTSLAMLIIVPIIAFMDKILIFWLKQPPEDAAGFAIIAIFLMLSDKISLGHKILVHAQGNIRLMNATTGMLYVASILVVWTLLRHSFSGVNAVGIGILVPAFAASFCKVLFAKKYLAIPLRYWMQGVLTPLIVISCLSFATCKTIRFLFDSTAGFFVCVAVNTVVVIAVFICFLNNQERQFVSQKLKKLLPNAIKQQCV